MSKTLSLTLTRLGEERCPNRIEAIKLLEEARAWLESLDWCYDDRQIAVQIALDVEMS